MGAKLKKAKLTEVQRQVVSYMRLGYTLLGWSSSFALSHHTKTVAANGVTVHVLLREGVIEDIPRGQREKDDHGREIRYVLSEDWLDLGKPKDD